MSSRNEWLMLADYAEVIAGKLYLHGGGWDRLTVGSEFPTAKIIGIAASFVVPWNETNKKIAARIEIQTQDGAIVGKPGRIALDQYYFSPAIASAMFRVWSRTRR